MVGDFQNQEENLRFARVVTGASRTLRSNLTSYLPAQARKLPIESSLKPMLLRRQRDNRLVRHSGGIDLKRLALRFP